MDHFIGLALDIETLPNTDLVGMLPEPAPAKNIKDPEKIKADIEKKRKDQISKMGVNPLFSVILCICVHNDKGAQGWVNESADLAGEKKLLTDFFDYLDKNDVIKLVTYNGHEFDLPFIYRRAALAGAAPYKTLSHWGSKYSIDKHFDIMQVWGHFREYIKLDTMAQVVLGQEKIDIDFTEFPELVKTPAGRKKILDYCAQDTALTWEIYKKIEAVF